MTNPQHHGDHPHRHGPDCGHTAIRHGDHVDYLHDGHLHRQEGDSVLEHSLPVNDENPDRCAPVAASSHADDHLCGPDCGHEAVPHGNHIDYIVIDADGNARLHHPHGDHCDDHGPVELAG